MPKEIPEEVKEVIIDGVEKILFPHPAKKLGGKILRVLFKIASVFLSKKKINI